MYAGAVAGALVVSLLAAGWRWRAGHMRAMTALTLANRRLGADGIVIGGEGFVLARAGAPAVLLLHGGGDTPQTLRYLAVDLHARGFHVSVPLLPGHGRSLSDFMRVTADDLTAAAASAYDDLKAEHAWVGIIGLSMGGALAVQLAANDRELSALGLVAPYLAMPTTIEFAARLSWLWGWMVPALRSGDGASILDPAEQTRSLAYGVFSTAALRALRRTMHRAAVALPRVAAPTLMIQSRQDNRITVAAATHAFARLGARDKRLEWVIGAGHIVTVDYGWEKVNASLVEWMLRHGAERAELD